MIRQYIFLILASEYYCDKIKNKEKKVEETPVIKKRQFFRTDSIKEAYDYIKTKFNNIKRKRTSSLQTENNIYQEIDIKSNEQIINNESAEYEEIIFRPTNNSEKSKRFSEPIDMSKRELPQIPAEDEVIYMEMVNNHFYENIDFYKEEENKCWYYKYTNNLLESPKLNETDDITTTYDGYCLMTIRDNKLIELSKKINNRLDYFNIKYRKQIESQKKHTFLIKVLKMFKFIYEIVNKEYGKHKSSNVALMYEDILHQLDEMEKWEINGCICKEKCNENFE